MALFKIFWGEEEKLSEVPKHAGYAYFTVDNHNLYIDIDDQNRVQVNAEVATALLRDGEQVKADQFVDIDDIIEVIHGGTGVETLEKGSIVIGNDTEPVTTLALPQNNFLMGGEEGPKAATTQEVISTLGVVTATEVDRKLESAITKAYEKTLSVSDWIEGQGDYTLSLQIETLKCGQDGNVPPLITYVDNLDEYSLIESAEATVNGENSNIVFHIKEKPNADIKIIVIDQM